MYNSMYASVKEAFANQISYFPVSSTPRAEEERKQGNKEKEHKRMFSQEEF